MSLGKRTIHLDFHTGPWIPDVAADFDPEEFARTFKDAHVDSVTVFATCHHGHAYWDTDRPERHPSLPAGLDLLGEQVRALHASGIKAPIYLTVQWNEFCANEHPDWIAVDPDGKLVHRPGASPLIPGWRGMDMSSPYQDYLADQLAEVLDRFHPVDGIFMDICRNQPSVSKWAIAGMKAADLDPTNPLDRDKYAELTAHRYMERYSTMVSKATVGTSGAGVWFNSRPKVNLHFEKKFIGHVEVEALPSGGWGYSYFPYVSRYVRPLGLPGLSHTGRFFKSWGDNTSLKPAAALKYECCQVLSQGFSNGVGDLLHPRGVPSKQVYDLIGSVFEYVERCEPFIEGARHVSEAALIVDPSIGDRPGPSGLGAVRALQQSRVQFDVRNPDADLSEYRLVIIPESTRVSATFAKALDEYAEAGGAVILSGSAGFTDEGAPVLAAQGIESVETSPFTHTFVQARPEVGADLADYPYVMYEPGYRVTAARDSTVLADLGEPYFERTWEHFSGHSYTPFKELTGYAAAVQSGSIVTFAVPLLEALGKHGAPNYKTLFRNVVDRLVPNRLVRDGGPSHMDVVLVETPETRVAHLLSFIPERRAEGLDIVEDPTPLVDVPISIRCDFTPRKVTLQPHGTELNHGYEDGYVSATVTVLDGHGMIVIQK